MAASFEVDLRAARERAGITIEQIQQDTRIPADVIERFEAGRLLSDPAFNEVYLKAFVQAYAGAIGLIPHTVLEAYALEREGRYQGELNPEGVASPPPVAPAPDAPSEAPEGHATPPVDEAKEEGAEEEAAAVPRPSVAPPPPSKPSAPPAAASSSAAPAVAALSSAPAPSSAKPDVSPQKPVVSRPRTHPSSVRGSSGTFDRSWGMILGVTVGVVAVVAAILWMLFREPSPEPEEVASTPVAADSSQVEGADTTETSTPVSSAPALQLPIRVSVLAGGNGLQNFRVTEAPNERLGHWVEPGTTVTYESSEALTLWGEGAEGMDPAEVTLQWQGFEWHPPAGQILRITPANGQRLLDSLATVSAR